MDIITSHLSKLSYTEISMAHIRLDEKVREAVFPVAGMGSRFLPATKASPKEMMPVASIVAPRVAR